MEAISQRRLRNDSGEILRRAAAGEVLRIRAGSTEVELRRASSSIVDILAASGRLSAASDDDFADFDLPGPGVEPLATTLDRLRGDR